MTIDNLLNWLQEAEDNNTFMVSTQSVKRHLEKIQKEQLILYGVISSCACDKPTLGKNTLTCGCGNPFNKVK